MRAELRPVRIVDPEEWNAFVDAAPYHAFPQLWEWGEVRAMAGWRPLRVAVRPGGGAPVAGAQLLLRRVPLTSWHLAYAPRGPIGTLDDPRVRSALLTALRATARDERIATLRVDPEAPPHTAYGRSLLEGPWRAAPKIQPPTTRLLDLRLGVDALRAAMKRKHRQYVGKAEREGVTVERIDGGAPPDVAEGALDDFDRIYGHTAERARFVARPPSYYRRVWSLFASTRRARLSFALLDGERVATLFHFTCGDRVVESYGGMTDAGAAAHANYLLKWSAIAGFAEEGFETYDMWGLATDGIRQFKEGFGGAEVAYVGARDIAFSGPVDAVLRVAVPAYSLAQRARHVLRGRGPAPHDAGNGVG